MKKKRKKQKSLKKKRNKNTSFFLLATSLLFIGAVAYIYMGTRLEEGDVEFDLYDEDSEIYY